MRLVSIKYNIPFFFFLTKVRFFHKFWDGYIQGLDSRTDNLHPCPCLQFVWIGALMGLISPKERGWGIDPQGWGLIFLKRIKTLTNIIFEVINLIIFVN